MKRSQHGPKRLFVAVSAVLVLGVLGYFVARSVFGVNVLSLFRGQEQVPIADGHSHPHEAEIVQATVWSGEVELFIDHEQPASGEEVEMALHVTKLSDGEPLTSGVVEFESSFPNETPVTVSAEAPAVPGIFLIKTTFPKPGRYKRTVHVNSNELAAGPAVISLPPLWVYRPNSHSHVTDEAADETITFLKPQQWRAKLLSDAVNSREIAEQLVVPGTVMAPHPSEAMVPPPVPGHVLPPPDGHFPHVGDEVTRGQVLALVEPSVVGADAVQLLVNRTQLQTLEAELAAKQLEVEAQITSAELERQLAEATFRRQRELSEQGVTAGKNLLLAQYKLDETEARLAGLRRLQRSYQETRRQLGDFRITADESQDQEIAPSSANLQVTLRSPIDGKVVEADVTSGEYVDHDHPLFRIVNLDRLFVEAKVSEYDLSRVETSPGAGFRLSAYPDRIIPIFPTGGGRLVYIGSVVNSDTRTVEVRYEVPNPDGLLRVGMYADVIIDTDKRQQALVVSEDAVVDDGGEAVVYVQLGGESFQRRPVLLGIRNAGLVEIRDGVQPDERVVIQGAYAIRLSTLSGEVPEHHHH